MDNLESPDPDGAGNLLNFVREHHFKSYVETRELREMIVDEFLTTADENERAVLLEIYEALICNLERSIMPGERAEFRATQTHDRRMMGNLKRRWFWPFGH